MDRQSDTGRLMEEIQTYLTTGRASPPAPDPTRPRRRRPHPIRAITRRIKRLRLTPRVWAVLIVAGLAAALIVTRNHDVTTTSVIDHASAAPAGPGYSFMRTNPGGTPTRWNPCQAIHYRTNLDEAPPGAADEVAAAIRQIEAATGLVFVDDGSTTVIPSTTYGQQATGTPAPVVIAWATPDQTDGLSAPVLLPGGLSGELGRGGPVIRIDPLTGHGIAVSGSVVIDATAAARLPSGFGPGALGVVLMHELGHVVGLGQTPDPDDVMDPVLQPTKDGAWGPGDLAGLARLGSASGCLRVPTSRVVVGI